MTEAEEKELDKKCLEGIDSLERLLREMLEEDLCTCDQVPGLRGGGAGASEGRGGPLRRGKGLTPAGSERILYTPNGRESMADDALAVAPTPQVVVAEKPSPPAKVSPEIEALFEQAQILLKSGFLPTHFNTAAKVVSVGMAAKEMGIGLQQAIRSMYVIDGKVGLSTNVLLGLAYKRIQGFWVRLIESTREKATVKMGRAGGSEAEVTFTMEDAMRAGLLAPPKSGKPGAWQKYQQDMCLNRALGKGLRIIAPDATMGMYSDEEVESVAAPAAMPLTQETATVFEAKTCDDPECDCGRPKEDGNGQG